MMFGKRRKPFDPAMIDKGTLGQGPSFNPLETPMGQALPDYMQMSANAPKVGQSFLDKPVVRTAMGTIGDLLLQNSGFDPVYAPQVQDQRRQSLLQQVQKAENAKWYEREQWKAQNAPKSPYRWEANDGSLMEVGPDGQPRVVYKDPTPKTQWVRVDNGNGTLTMTPIGPQGAPAAAPAAPKGKLKPYGGPTASQSGGFPR